MESCDGFQVGASDGAVMVPASAETLEYVSPIIAINILNLAVAAVAVVIPHQVAQSFQETFLPLPLSAFPLSSFATWLRCTVSRNSVQRGWGGALSFPS